MHLLHYLPEIAMMVLIGADHAAQQYTDSFHLNTNWGKQRSKLTNRLPSIRSHTYTNHPKPQRRPLARGPLPLNGFSDLASRLLRVEPEGVADLVFFSGGITSCTSVALGYSEKVSSPSASRFAPNSFCSSVSRRILPKR